MFFRFKIKVTGVPVPSEENQSIYSREGWDNSYMIEFMVGPFIWYAGFIKPINDPHVSGSKIDWEWGWD